MAATNDWIAVFFILFYILTVLIMLNIFTSIVLQSFTMREQHPPLMRTLQGPPSPHAHTAGSTLMRTMHCRAALLSCCPAAELQGSISVVYARCGVCFVVVIV